MRVVAAVLAAGSGTRMGSDKVLLPLRGKPVWAHSYETLKAHPDVAEVGLVCSATNLDWIRREAQGAAFVAMGGSTRPESARVAFDCAAGADLLLLQDAARPFVTSKMISDVLAAALRSGASAPAVEVTDTIKRQSEGGLETLDRTTLRAIQTPQAIRIDLLARAYTEGVQPGTDDLSLVEALGVTPELVAGDPRAFKITTPEDYRRAQWEVGMPETRTGFGYDIHPFADDPDRPMMLGGIQFEDCPGLQGHSDADVLLHAIVDAILGAVSLGDIGQHFPNTDPRWKDQPSLTFLRHAGDLLVQKGWRILNLDAT
ncbi:MAG TPA: 2-C-methyl-D-erythritol 4-phosphate cytidylyltransferase, partial [Fimbriimonadaceae bacterium]|nr:2-C-methyl-D-erythritol 4-phosphate cytidylyltransferase [Fimbriimonadaceae bacterium]